MESIQLGLFGKTSPESCQTRPTGSAACSAHWLEVVPPSIRLQGADGPTRVWLLDPADPLLGGSLTPSGSAWPNDGSACSCSLAEVLEQNVSPKYYLSPLACAGILRRAERRGKELPPMLRQALEGVVRGGQESVTAEDKIQSLPASADPTRGGAIDVATACNAHGGTGRHDFESETFVAFTQNQRDELREVGISGALSAEPGMKQQTYVAFSSKDHGADAGDLAPTLRAAGHDGSHANAGAPPAVAFHATQDPISGEISPALGQGSKSGCGSIAAQQGMAVRRLTPRECCRLQGFVDDWTLITVRGKPAADGPRYKALGNSMAVPVMAWIGRRIAEAET